MPTILVVEDRPDVQQVLREMLEEAGYDVLVADDGYRALQQLARSPVDLVLLDIILPNMDGLELIMQMKKKAPDVRIVAYSGGGRLLDKQTATFLAERLGAGRVLQKPFTEKVLLQAIEEVLAETGVPPASRSSEGNASGNHP